MRFFVLTVLAVPAILNAAVRWPETRPRGATGDMRSVLPIFASAPFWTYTLAFGAGMGTFFVFFSTAPRVLIGRAGYSEFAFSLVFATVAVVMIVTTRLAKTFIDRWGIAGCVARGMILLLCGAFALALGQVFGSPSFASFILPMWIMAVGIVLTVSVTANGALAEFGEIAGSAVAFYFCIQSLIVSVLGTLAVTMLGGDSAWPLSAYSAIMALLVLLALGLLPRRDRFG